MKNFLPILVICAVAGGCVIGMPRYGPGGVATTVFVQDRDPIKGELLAAMQDHLIVLDEYSRIFRIYYPAISRATFQGAGSRVKGGQPPDSSGSVLLRSISAFPQGLTDSMLTLVGTARKAAGVSEIRR